MSGSKDKIEAIFTVESEKKSTNDKKFEFEITTPFFSISKGKSKRNNDELNVLDIVKDILTNKQDSKSINQSQELVKLHRVIENTKARKRLETWSLKVIVVYLVIVLLLVLSNYLYTGWFDATMDIPENVMIAILTTTTVNIIGLGLIVLRGHFLANEVTKEEEKK